MMTVVIRGRRTRRQPLIDYPSPRTWCIGAERYYCRMWTPEAEAGSAKPGRGGRRKRRRRAAGERAAALYIQVTDACSTRMEPWPRGLLTLCDRAFRLRHPVEIRGETPGRRERRRRAKLRRRRTRAETRVTWREEMAALVGHSGRWEPAVTGWQPFDSGEVYRG